MSLFGLPHNALVSCVDYIIEREPLVNRFISVPKDKKFINCASFVGGIIEAILNECCFVSFLFCFDL